jgi:hypothetical protein
MNLAYDNVFGAETSSRLQPRSNWSLMGAGANNTEFDDFVRRQQTLPSTVDWQKERDEWLSHLNDLYAKMQSFLIKYTSSGQITLRFENILLDEEYIGSYTAQQMKVRIGRQEVILLPIGTFLLGSKGRVDVIGPAGRAELLLVDKRAVSPRSLIRVVVGVGEKLQVPPDQPSAPVEWEWRILSRPPERRFIEITQDTLFQLIMEVANG